MTHLALACAESRVDTEGVRARIERAGGGHEALVALRQSGCGGRGARGRRLAVWCEALGEVDAGVTGLSERDDVDTGEPDEVLDSEEATDGGRGSARVGLGGVTSESCDVEGIVRRAGTARSARARGWRSVVQKGPPVAEDAEDEAEDDDDGCGSSAAQAVRVLDAEDTVRASDAAVGAW